MSGGSVFVDITPGYMISESGHLLIQTSIFIANFIWYTQKPKDDRFAS